MSATILHLLQIYQFPAILVGSFLFGQTVVIAAAFLAGQELWNVWNVFFICLLGNVVSDMMWYFIGTHFTSWIEKHEKHGARYKKVIGKVNKYVGKKIFLTLILIKFLYGTRIFTIFYMTARKLNFWRFMVLNTLGTIIWLAIIIGGGYLAGRGTANYLGGLTDIKFVILALVAFILLYKLLDSWTEKKIMEE